MNKFARKLKKLNKHARNILIVGNACGSIEELVDYFRTIFLIDDKKRIFRAKNVVYRENFDNIHLIDNVDIILVDLDHENRLVDLTPVFKRWNPVIVLEGPDLISKENQKFLKSNNYQIVDIYKRLYVWNLK